MLLITLFIILIALFLSLCFLINRYDIKANVKHSFSILIACRNEEENVAGLLESLKALNYPAHLWQAVIVDDASSDITWQLLQKYNNADNIQILQLKKKSTEYKGKKAALRLAAKEAEYDYFLFTDADCRLHPDALNDYNKCISPDCGAVVGWYITHKASTWQRISDLMSALTFSLSIYLKKPFSASGMNWLVSRKAFSRVNGYDSIKKYIAGDDKLLLLLIAKAGFKVRFNPFHPAVTFLEKQMDKNRLKRKYGKFKSNPLSIKLFIILAGIFLLWLPLSLLGSYYFFLSYLISVWMIWISCLIHLKTRLKFSDFFLIPALPYLIIYFTIVGSLGNWDWKNQKKK